MTMVATAKQVSTTLIPWIDIETTGLLPSTDCILQVALIITDGSLKEVSRHDWIIQHDNLEELKAGSDSIVQDIHEKTGLWDRLASKEAQPIEEVDAQLSSMLSYIRDGSRWGVKIGGNSVTFDRDFLKAHLPLTREQMSSHQVMDMSSVLEFFRMVGHRVELPKHYNTHNAMEDVENCVDQARHTLAQLTR